MPSIRINTFSGEIPKLDPKLLPTSAAQIAKGCHFYHGTLAPIKDSIATGDTVVSNAKSIFLYLDQFWFAWDKKVNAVKSPIASDPYQRVYFTGDGFPKFTTNEIYSGANMPAASYRLGVQAPENIITAIVTEGAVISGEEPTADDDETRYYTHTYVTAYGEESAPGDASGKVEILTPLKADTYVTLSLQPPNTNESNIVSRRIYRTSTGGGIADYLLVAEIPIAQTTFVDNVSSDQLGASLDTYDYERPPIDMQGLTAMANGILAGFTGNTVCFSEAYLPYAWPVDYQMTTEHDIVAMVAMGNSLAVLTKGYPYIFSGVTPDAMAGQKIETNQSCTNDRSAVLVDGALIYASPDGLMQLTVNGVVSLTDKIITKAQWQQYRPETIEAYCQEGRYLAFYGIGLDKAFIFDPKTGDFRHFDKTAYCGFESLLDDALYFSQGGVIYKWESNPTTMNYTWRSKKFTVNDMAFSCGIVKGDNLQNSGLKIFADGVSVINFTQGNIPVQAFRLPEVRGDEWEIELTGTGEIKEVVLSTSMAELRQVVNG